ncbi:response regulator transcription factor [Pseudomonas fontis]|uniref:Response regulator transcription factor n=1 Tax=Pseudomonas fontis TaxID=2942633 RepID=A0ABT5NQ38_9PSED|nr:response regulator transcription factor [Pseudomonas fontis]MDD0972832.1 response regulator transcription factor [Pseudomonas fontis]MDD0990289.1 response regulator transcription factor [Pseudomonas fontis]
MRALVVDDHGLMRLAVKIVLLEHGVDEVFEVDNGLDGLHEAIRLEPDIMVVDILMGKFDGLEMVKRLRSRGSRAKILMLSSLEEQHYVDRCMAVGADGFISKVYRMDELGLAIESFKAGYTYFNKPIEQSGRNYNALVDEKSLLKQLSNREVMVMEALLKGQTNKQIGETMLISNKTVSTYKTRLLEKLKLRTVVDLVEFSNRNRL